MSVLPQYSKYHAAKLYYFDWGGTLRLYVNHLQFTAVSSQRIKAES